MDLMDQVFAELRRLREAVEQPRVEPLLVSKVEAAKRLGVSVKTINRMVKAGALLVTAPIGSTPMVPMSELRRLAQPEPPKDRRRKPPAPRKPTSGREMAERLRARLGG